MKKQVLFILFYFYIVLTFGQQITDSSLSTIKYQTQIQTGFTSNDQVPFWLRSNNFGSIPTDGVSLSILGSAEKPYSLNKKKYDWGFGVEGRGNIGTNQNLTLIEGYLKAKVGVIELKAGRSKDMGGLVDSSLSSGSFNLSGNALGIPKVQLSIPDFQEIQFGNHLIAIKGSFSHGWMGTLPIQYLKSPVTEATSYFHESTLFARFGKPNWRLRLYGGINHEVIWGSDKAIFQEQYNLNQTQAFYYVVTGKKYKGADDISKIGNHLGSIDVGLEYKLDKVDIKLYRQNFYEKGAIAYMANILDGLNGISFTNKNIQYKNYWKKILVEVFYSKNQAGEEDSKATPSGPEYYYNHAVYTNGYSYKGLGLGTPLITPYNVARSDLPNAPINYFINNRVLALHTGAEGRVSEVNFKIKLTYSRNSGEYRTSDNGYWFNGARYTRIPVDGIFSAVNQFSGYIDLEKYLKNGFHVGGVVAIDRGMLLYNSIGGVLKISKSW